MLPAILSSQKEIGVRIQGPKSLAVTAALFDLKKPYPGFSPGGRYELVGTLENQGVEVSVLAHPITGLTVLGGLYAAKPKLDGGAAPLGSFRRQAQLYLDYALPRGPRASVDLRHTYQGATVVRSDLKADARTEAQLGARWRQPSTSHSLARDGGQRVWRGRLDGRLHRRTLEAVTPGLRRLGVADL